MDSGKLTVAHVCDDLMIGGWTSLVSQIKALPSDIEPVVFCLFGKGANAKILEEAGIEVLCLNLNKINLIFRIIRLGRLFRDRGVDIVHTHLSCSTIIGFAAAYLAGVQLKIAHLHNMGQHVDSLSFFIEKKILARSDRILAVSNAVKKSNCSVFEIAESQVEVLYNTVEMQTGTKTGFSRESLGLGESDFVLLCVANLKPEKGHIHLIRAMELIRDETVKLIVVGDGFSRIEIEDEVGRTGQSGRILMEGRRETPEPYYAVSDLFVFPSRQEAFGIVILEAFRAGLPVVASDVGGIREVTDNGRCALLVPPSNPGALADAILRMKNEEVLRKRISELGVERIKDFEPRKNAERLASIYRELEDGRKNSLG